MCCDVTIKYHETSPLRVADQDYKKTKAIQFKILKTLKRKGYKYFIHLDELKAYFETLSKILIWTI